MDCFLCKHTYSCSLEEYVAKNACLLSEPCPNRIGAFSESFLLRSFSVSVKQGKLRRRYGAETALKRRWRGAETVIAGMQTVFSKIMPNKYSG